MKKFLCIALAVVLTLSMVAAFAACSKDNGDTSTTAAGQETTAAAQKATENQKVKVVDIELSKEEYAFGVNKGDAELLKKTNELIKEIKENGKFDEICEHYFGGGKPEPVMSAEEDSSKDQLLVATNAAFEPFEFKKGEAYLGIDMEIAKLLADSLGKELVIKNMKFEAVITSVQQGKADIAMAGLTVKPDRAKQVNFSDSYYNAAQKLVVKGDDTTFDACKTKEDVEAILAKYDASTVIGGQNGTTGQSYVQGDKEFGFTGLKTNWKGYDNASLAIQDLINGNVNLVIIDSAPAAAVTKAMNEMA
ncbi:MAG: transporter substrate-binding domain-containing protein [Clostridia bacterium]|nr:transporter substrate-binding domain-containing protein [Clostridia bacterium]